MDRRPFSTRPAYVQSIRGLLRLHALSLLGQDETAGSRRDPRQARACVERLDCGREETDRRTIRRPPPRREPPGDILPMDR